MILASFSCDAGQKTLLSYYNGALVPLATSGCMCDTVDCEEVAQILDKQESFGEKCSIEKIKSREGYLNNIKIFEENRLIDLLNNFFNKQLYKEITLYMS